MNIRHDRPKKTIPLWYWIKAPPHSVDRRSGLNPYGGNSRCSSTSTLDTPAKASAEQWMMLMLLGFNVSSLGDQVSSTGWYGSIRWGLYGVNQSRWGVQCRPFETIEQSIHVSQCMRHTYRSIHTYLHTHTHTYTYTDTDTYTDTYTYRYIYTWTHTHVVSTTWLAQSLESSHPDSCRKAMQGWGTSTCRARSSVGKWVPSGKLT